MQQMFVSDSSGNRRVQGEGARMVMLKYWVGPKNLLGFFCKMVQKNHTNFLANPVCVYLLCLNFFCYFEYLLIFMTFEMRVKVSFSPLRLYDHGNLIGSFDW